MIWARTYGFTSPELRLSQYPTQPRVRSSLSASLQCFLCTVKSRWRFIMSERKTWGVLVRDMWPSFYATKPRLFFCKDKWSQTWGNPLTLWKYATFNDSQICSDHCWDLCLKHGNKFIHVLSITFNTNMNKCIIRKNYGSTWLRKTKSDILKKYWWAKYTCI